MGKIFLIDKEPAGGWELSGCSWEEFLKALTTRQFEKVYMAMAKLKDYEESGLQPDELGELQDIIDDLRNELEIRENYIHDLELRIADLEENQCKGYGEECDYRE